MIQLEMWGSGASVGMLTLHARENECRDGSVLSVGHGSGIQRVCVRLTEQTWGTGRKV